MYRFVVNVKKSRPNVIDDAIEGKEREYVLLHERNRMASGGPYQNAHAERRRDP